MKTDSCILEGNSHPYCKFGHLKDDYEGNSKSIKKVKLRFGAYLNYFSNILNPKII